MIPRASITFVPTQVRISGFVTKFGGQPTWCEKPQWPVSRLTGQPMMFVCQISLDVALFPGTTGRMAYVFINNEDGAEIAWDPEGGENAVIVQPGINLMPVSPRATGPSLFERVEQRENDRIVREPREFAVALALSEDPPFRSEVERESWSHEQYKTYAARLSGNKIGGTPIFLQSDEFPKGDGWRLLLQLDSVGVPFWINFGDAGIGYAFLNSAGSAGKLLWQCA
jgi:uncharacterized protein YwqG